jgi:EmrB/QacA subfamily drug resistance transporter
MFQVAIVIFLIGSILSGLAQTMLQLIVFRGVQGAGAGGLMAMAMAIIGEIVSPRQRGRYVGYLVAVFAAASVVGPLIGGFFVDNLSWRWIFYINVPIGAVALVVTSLVLRLPFVRVRRPLDIAGAALLIAAVTCILLVSLWGGSVHPWLSLRIVSLAVVSVTCTMLFVVQQRRAPEPILPLRLFSNDVFTVSSVVSFLVGAAMFGAMVFLPVFLQGVRGASATNSGLLVLPLMAGLMSMSLVSGRVIARTGHYRSWPIAGMGIAVVGMALLSRLDEQSSWVTSTIAMVVLGLGLGMVMQVLTLAVQNSVSYADLGTATAAVTFFRQMGSTIGVAAFGAIFASRLHTEITRLLPRAAGALDPQPLSSTPVSSTPAQIRSLPPPIRDGLVEALSRSLHTVFLIAVPVLVLGFALSWLLRQLPLSDTAHVDARGSMTATADSLPT